MRSPGWARLQKKKLKRIIKKEEKNLDDQINILEKLVNGFRDENGNWIGKGDDPDSRYRNTNNRKEKS